MIIIEMSLSGNVVSLQCLYCNRVFKDRTTLRDHMRKKQHRKLNPQDKKYDKFYIINYLVSSCEPVCLRSRDHVTRKWVRHGKKYKLRMMGNY